MPDPGYRFPDAGFRMPDRRFQFTDAGIWRPAQCYSEYAKMFGDCSTVDTGVEEK